MPEQRYERVDPKEIQRIEADPDAELDRLIPPSLPENNDVDFQPNDEQRVFDPNIENDMTADFDVRVNYESVPDLCRIIAHELMNHIETPTGDLVYGALCTTVSSFPCEPSIANFRSVTSFLMHIRPLRNAPAKALSAWNEQVLPKITSHKSLNVRPHWTIDDFDFAVPCSVIFITTNVYAFVFFERIKRPLGSTEYDDSRPLKLIGGMIVPGAGV